MRQAFVVATCMSVTLASATATADDKAVCLSASLEAQTLRDAHKLIEAREKLAVCAHPKCPPVVAKDCVTWLGEVEKLVPTVVVSAKDAAGEDLDEVKVTVDGRALIDKLDGFAVPLNPGARLFHFAGRDGATLDQQVMVKDGQKYQAVAIVLTKGTLGVEVPPPPAPENALSSTMPPLRLAGLLTGGVGVVGVVVGSVFGLLTIGARNSQQSDCATASNCANRAQAISDHSTMTNDGAISTVAFVVGGVLFGGGGAMYLLGGRSSEPSPATGVDFVPSFSPGQGGVAMRGSF